ncbi:unnamed protein product [Toxocara canis]|uniref:Uncharacterized protein n=1 Tax=Toxocara canis TaxID=6265 RepID=A0A183U8Z6_TOXCA|nr:unnamed protein product [Toxocara canis]
MVHRRSRFANVDEVSDCKRTLEVYGRNCWLLQTFPISVVIHRRCAYR